MGIKHIIALCKRNPQVLWYSYYTKNVEESNILINALF